MKVAVIGVGWAGCAAAVEATRRGQHVTVFEAARIAGGRARRLPDSPGLPILDNGQHILIGAYTDTLALLHSLGVDVQQAFLRLPLRLVFPDGQGLSLPDWPAPWDALAGVLTARGWRLADKLALLQTMRRWQRQGFSCAPEESVAGLCQGLPTAVLQRLMEPLCVSALNTPMAQASGQVFLRVLRDALWGPRGASHLLLPRCDLSAVLPEAALAWLQGQGGNVHLGQRVQSLLPHSSGWTVQTREHAENFDAVLLACTASEAARLVAGSAISAHIPAHDWLALAQGLRYEAITTVYTQAPGLRLRQPLLALNSTAEHPAQFVFDRGQLGGPIGLLAWVVSASQGNADQLTAQVLAQGAQQLGVSTLIPVQTVVEKRATFACTPGLQRPASRIAPGLLACGDYIQGPYPATLEGAVRSGLAAARELKA